MDPELLPGSGSGTRKIQSWIRIRIIPDPQHCYVQYNVGSSVVDTNTLYLDTGTVPGFTTRVGVPYATFHNLILNVKNKNFDLFSLLISYALVPFCIFMFWSTFDF